MQAFTKEELEDLTFNHIKTFEDAVETLKLDIDDVLSILTNLKVISPASAASFKINIIRRALNKGKDMSFLNGIFYYPYTPVVLSNNSYCKDSSEVEVAKVKIGGNTFSLFGGLADFGADTGLGCFFSEFGVAGSYTDVGFLGCATEEIAQHMSKYFAKEIFDAKYADLIHYTWVK